MGNRRREFLTMLGRTGAGTCMCGVLLGERVAAVHGVRGHARDDTATQTAESGFRESPGTPSARRMAFVDGWVPRLFAVMDRELDASTRKRIMVANGRACFLASQPDTVRRAAPATLEQIAAWVAERGKADGYSMDGNTIVKQYMQTGETGAAAPNHTCLCQAAEAQTPATISPSFCWCSIGYVEEMHERAFGRPVKVDLVQSVLRGDACCRFRMTVA